MAKQEGFHMVDHGPFPIMEFKLGDKSISAEELVRAAEQMRLELLKHGVVVQIQSKAKQEAA
jgi:hypothetical protein